MTVQVLGPGEPVGTCGECSESEEGRLAPPLWGKVSMMKRFALALLAAAALLGNHPAQAASDDNAIAPWTLTTFDED